MKNTIVLGLLFVLSFTACKKNDIEKDTVQTAAEVSSAKQAEVSQWATAQNWTSSGTNSQATISDQAINSAVAGEGLVLLYAQSNNTSVSLPAQVGSSYLYYQVEAGAIQVNAVTKEGTVNKDQQFSYVILSKDRLESLEKKGFSKLQLMGMDYSAIKGLIN